MKRKRFSEAHLCDAGDLHDAIGAPSILLSAEGAVIRVNYYADLLLKAKDGVSVLHGRLALWDVEAQFQLDAAIGRTCKREWSTAYRVGAEVLAMRPSGCADLVVIATPLGVDNPIAGAWATARCVVNISEERRRMRGRVPERLRRLYGLTEAETEVATSLARGCSTTDIAAQRGTSVETVRKQVKATMVKTNTHRQGELALLIHRLTS